jgi:hypothetical protein
VTAETGGEDEPLADPAPLTVGDESESSEVNLQLDPGRRVGDAHRDGASPGPTALDCEARQGPVRNHHAPAGQQDPDLDDGEVLFDPGGDLGLFGEQYPPGLAVTVDAVRAHLFEHRTDQLIAELIGAARAIKPKLDGGEDVAPGRLAVDADRPRDGALTLTFQPAPERLFDLDHRYLPKCHGAPLAVSVKGPAECIFGRHWWMVRVVP